MSLYSFQEKVLIDVKAKLSKCDVLYLNTPPGYGKSKIIEEYARKNKRKNNILVYLPKVNKSKPYGTILNPKYILFSVRKIVIILVLNALRLIPIAGSAITISIKEIKNDVINTKIDKKAIRILNRFSTKRKTNIIIFDDFDRWDKHSQNVASNIIDKVIKNKKYDRKLMICNSGNIAPTHDGTRIEKIDVLEPSYDELEKIIREIALTPLHNEDVKLLLGICGGNIRYLSLFLERLDLMENPTDVVHQLENRMSYFKDSEELLKIIKLASVIGIQFEEVVLSYFTGHTLNLLRIHMKQMKNLGIFDYQEQKNQWNFVSDLLQNHIIKHLSNSNEKTLFSEYTRLLLEIYPTDFDRISESIDKNPEGSKEFTMIREDIYIQLTFGLLRNGKYDSSSSILNNEIIEKFVDIYKLIEFNKKALACNQLKNMVLSNADNQLYRFERDYLLSLLFNESSTLNKINSAVQILSSWFFDNRFMEKHIDPWIRSGILLLELMTDADDQRYSQVLNTLLNTIKSFKHDVRINYYLHQIKLNSNMYLNLAIATMYTNDSLKYFKEHQKEYPYNYYKALINHSANFLMIGDTKLAKITLEEAISLQYRHNSAHEDVIRNNQAIINFLSGKVKSNVQTIINSYQQMISENIFENNDLDLAMSNYAAFLLISKDDENINLAYDILKRLCEKYIKTNYDTYYKYFILNNYIMVLLYLKKYQIALNLAKLTYVYTPSKFLDTELFKERNQLLIEQIENKSFITNDIVNYDFINGIRINEVDEFFLWGRYVLLSELQVWNTYKSNI
jgi:hypothetical protein